ncbi:MAG TPA: ABC transporter ATP-binding protein [Candidatus Didemnitutus sp.]|nr:ABC transporter ATP-binding protein [Candidatus Didemnitutus sp.]
MNTVPIISVRNLTKAFGSFTAVDAISFDVAPGEIFGFLGANGAGKTTAMKMLCGLLSPTSGEARVAGFDLATQTEDVKRRIGYMSQKFSLYEDLTVEENIRFYGGIYGLTLAEIRRKTAELAADLGLVEEMQKLVRSLPLGWKQKIAFSVALLHDPAIVFLDEPTGGVDPVTRRQFWDLIYAAAHRGVTLFVTTHYMDEAEYCHRVSIMVDGAIKALDTPHALRKRFGASSMDDVFTLLARGAQRSAD